MPLNFEETTDRPPESDSMSEKARDALQVLRRFRSSHAPDAVFHSIRSRQIDGEDILDWPKS